MINVTESDITLIARNIIGLIHAMDQSIARVDCPTISDNDPNNLQPHLSNIQFGGNLTTEQKRTAQNLINQYADVFTVNPKKPQTTNLMKIVSLPLTLFQLIIKRADSPSLGVRN